jgi:MoaA/NifB/PqqE/SkfB family radical SAM enzyme
MTEAVSRLVGRAIEARVSGDGRPFIVAHLVTNRCMCSCASCLWKDNDCEDVPLEELKRFYREAREGGFVAAALSGGEPFLRKDLGALVHYLKEEVRFLTALFTTGWFLERRMDEVLPYIDLLIVSADSARPERHDAIRGLPGLFAALTRGVRLARERYPDLPIRLNCCVQRGVEGEIDDLCSLADSLDVRISFDVVTELRHGDGDRAYRETDVGLAPEALRRVCTRLLELKRAGAPIVNSEYYFDYFVRGRPGYRCHLPKLVMFVDGRGNLEHCLDLTRPLGNLRDAPLADLMASARFRRLRVEAEGCSTCNSPTMVDLSHFWEEPQSIFRQEGIALG